MTLSPHYRFASDWSRLSGIVLAILVTALLVLSGGGCTEDEPEIHPETAALLHRSDQAMRQDQLEFALQLAHAAVDREPRSADAHFQLGRVLSKMQRFEEADEAYKQTTEFKEDYAQAYLNLGNNASRQRRHREAVRHYEKATEEYPVQAMVSIGRAYMSVGENDSAESALLQAVRNDSSSAQARAWLSVLYENLGRFEEAAEQSSRAVYLDTQNADHHFLLGSQLLKLDRHDEAVAHLRRVHNARPWHYGATYKLGRALAQQGKIGEAERYLARADTLQQLQKDITRQQELIRQNPNHPDSWRKLGVMLRAVGQSAEAERAHARARALDSRVQRPQPERSP